MNFSSFVQTGAEQLSRLQTTCMSCSWLFCMSQGKLQRDSPARYMQVLSSKQLKKPSKLFAPGSSRVGYSIYVRALSRDDVEARWVHRFVKLATCDPSECSNII